MVIDSSKDYGTNSILMSCEDETTKDDVFKYLKYNYNINIILDDELVEIPMSKYNGYINPKMYEYTPHK